MKFPAIFTDNPALPVNYIMCHMDCFYDISMVLFDYFWSLTAVVTMNCHCMAV